MPLMLVGLGQPRVENHLVCGLLHSRQRHAFQLLYYLLADQQDGDDVDQRVAAFLVLFGCSVGCVTRGFLTDQIIVWIRERRLCSDIMAASIRPMQPSVACL